MNVLPISVLVFAAAGSVAAMKNDATPKVEQLSLNRTAENTGMTPTEVSGSESTKIRTQRECSIPNLNSLKSKIIIALERQIEKMMKDDYVDNHPESEACTHFRGLTMSYPIRLFIRTTVENAILDYKLELIRP